MECCKRLPPSVRRPLRHTLPHPNDRAQSLQQQAEESASLSCSCGLSVCFVYLVWLVSLDYLVELDEPDRPGLSQAYRPLNFWHADIVFHSLLGPSHRKHPPSAGKASWTRSSVRSGVIPIPQPQCHWQLSRDAMSFSLHTH